MTRSVSVFSPGLSVTMTQFLCEFSFLALQGMNEVLEADEMAKNDMDVHGVPYFVVNNKYHLEGAQPTAALFNAFAKASR